MKWMVEGEGGGAIGRNSASPLTMANQEMTKRLENVFAEKEKLKEGAEEGAEERAEAYAQLVQMAEHLDPNSILPLLPRLLNSILRDVSNEDEEIAALALKALGFILYHPILVASISDMNAYAVLQSLVEVIATTKMKAICNLAMWCISIQQFESCFIISNIHSIIRATVNALENPMGSVSTTVEAFQAVVKLIAQAGNIMRNLSHIWLPPIYRRLVSTDKRERDMAERCLQKLRSTILPPSPFLSKTVAADIKHNLLLHMEKLLQRHGCKVYVMQAWGWLIRLLGDHTMKMKTLVNQMLKIPEQTFADPDPQVCIASQVAWEALIDVLIQWPTKSMADQNPKRKKLSASRTKQTVLKASKRIEIFRPHKNLKLLMKPIIGLMTCKSDISVQLSCWKTWNYILHKLDDSVNNPAVLSIVLGPILKVIFDTGPDNKNLWIWDLCRNLLEEFVSLKVKDKYELDYNAIGENLSPRSPYHGISLETNKDKFPFLPIKWFPWNLIQIEFLLDNVRILLKCGIRNCELSEFSGLSLNGALRILRLILKGVQIELNEKFEPLNEHVRVVHLIVKFVHGLCQDIEFRTSLYVKGQNSVIFNLLEVIKDELPPSALASSSFNMPFKLEEIWNANGSSLLHGLDCGINGEMLGILISKIDMVSPAVYLILVWLSVVVHLSLDASEEDNLLERLEKQTQIVASGVNCLDNFQALATALYALEHVDNALGNIHMDRFDEGKRLESFPFKCNALLMLKVWKVFTKCLKNYIEVVNDVYATEDVCYQTIYSFLLFPLKLRVLYSFANSNDRTTQCTFYKRLWNVSSEKESDLVLQAWISLYNSVNLITSLKCPHTNFFVEGFCKIALSAIEQKHHEYISKQISQDNCSTKFKQLSFAEYDYHLTITGKITAYVLKQTRFPVFGMKKTSRKEKINRSALPALLNFCPGGSDAQDQCNVKGILTFVARFLEIAIEINDMNAYCIHVIVSRLFDAVASFLSCLTLRHDILLFMQKFSLPLAKWLLACPNIEMISAEPIPVFQLGKAWDQLLNCLQKSQPSIIFDSKFLNNHAPLFVAAFRHPHSSIANRTVAFWEAVYGGAPSLSYPASLVPVLRNLSQKMKISLPDFNKSTKEQVPLTYISTHITNGDVLEQVNSVTSNHQNTDSENLSTSYYQSMVNKSALFIANDCHTDVVSHNIRGCKLRHHSHSGAKTPSRNLQSIINTRKGGSGLITQRPDISQRTKKLEFMDGSPDIHYVSIPSTRKRKQSLTDHQQEVKRAQQGQGVDTMGHGPGIKTYSG